jgi:hypothetical protein
MFMMVHRWMGAETITVLGPSVDVGYMTKENHPGIAAGN